MSIGVSFPFQSSTGSLGYFEVTNDTASAIETNVRSLLLTNWGERPMHSSLGCNFAEFVFEPRTQSLRNRVADRVNSQLRTWLPFISVKQLFIAFHEDDLSVPENGFRVHLNLLWGNRTIVVTQFVVP